ncbi:MAG: MltA domain-containing protein [Rhodocyclaceae bacterium]|nr:MltA domain-containing protein [Rhodocyclaceae bacterium]
MARLRSGRARPGAGFGRRLILGALRREFNRSPMPHSFLRRALAAATLGLLGACASPPPPPCPETVCPVCPVCPSCPKCPEVAPPPPPPPAAVPDTGRLRATGFGALPGFDADRLLEALPALQQSCTRLGEVPNWASFCTGLRALGEATDEASLRAYLTASLQPWQVINADGSDSGMVTGYYEPLIRGRLARDAQARWPIHGVPDDLVSVELAGVYPDLAKFRLRGRLEGSRLKPYWTRGEIARLGADLPAPVLLWAEDPIELFFLQVQGSGRVALPDGRHVRIGYADQNGHPYVSIGRWLIEQGEMTLSEASMDGIKGWAAAHPERLGELLSANPSYVFFRQLPAGDGGPIGALGVPLTDGRSIAVDPRTVPLGAPVFIDTTEPNSPRPLRRLVAAQDTGGAIKGGVRADFFWGFGPEAGRRAGRMRQDGRLWVLLPVGHRPDQAAP